MNGSWRSPIPGLILILVLAIWPVFVQAESAEGVVFIDENGNAVLDGSDQGCANVPVSDGVTVVLTDEEGRFSLPMASDARFVFVTVPTGTAARAAWYLPVEAEGAYDFPLERAEDGGALVFVQLSDPHYAPDPAEFKEAFYDREMAVLPAGILDGTVGEVNAMSPDFVIMTGDIVADSKRPDVALVDKWMNYMATEFGGSFDAPFYATIGNHDVVRDEAIGKSVYETYFGPTYYSFDIKGTHCVVLDTQQLEGSSLVYTIDARQLAWLEQDLTHVAPNVPILVFCHEPTPDWVKTAENEGLTRLLAETGITALIDGHWHTNAVLQEEPFYELTSGALCAAWWEGPAADGSGFGYRVFRMQHGNLDSIWRDVGEEGIWFARPREAVLMWAERLHAQVWGPAVGASYRWDDGPSMRVASVIDNGLWSSASANLNVSTLSVGYHTLTVEFTMADTRSVTGVREIYVANPSISLEDIMAHADVYQGRTVAAPELVVRATMGSDLSASDGTKTIIISGFPYAVARNDLIGIVGMYRPTSAAPIKGYDEVFFTVYTE
jgi:3',5'-cyclic AMP phosphodiesterase CpdA